MSDKPIDLLQTSGLDEETARQITSAALKGADDGELYLEYSQDEGLVFDNGRLKSSTFSTGQGFGLRAVVGEATGYAHSGDISEAALKRAADAVSSVQSGHAGTYAEAPARTNQKLYTDENPIGSPTFAEKVKLLQEIDAYARAKDSRVQQVTISLAGSWKTIDILRADGHRIRDVRPLVRLNVSIIASDGDKQESGSYGAGGREGFGEFVAETSWQHAVEEALRQALVNLEAIPAPAGTFDVVLGNGWPGILLHEAIGHGLEGDFNRKKTSAFAGLMGQQVASKGVTIVDDGTISKRRGSLSVDDEGTPTGRTTLIEDGILVGYMQDRQNARLMGVEPTGNGRRESYAHQPLPRMTNTIMENGDQDPKEILESLEDGIYAVSFGGGQVDITSGKFVFSCTEAYRVQNGKIGAPVKGAMLIGNGPDALTRVTMIGNDMKLDPGIGTCGKAGQGVPVGVGQPTMRINEMTIGGTAT
ncbi:metalloprotease TldD [Pseudovibrio sp. Tun.PSC04-5.I4]|uniref:metalloprotease TldD n=1 Tax=Pseudovibrio sp. Tun.PSC04-5.I4 TaxID=1798213 RepID=UPI00088E3654|nr:metalloprotease TldD [Pseudovibrio sp. Tun.PSC04-5.I4]SDQ79665.1 microcin-processing peptidase 2. Unknown type peptidase. MEROPS family U62 [Pseudovibrio sp. Tun.PSC04-5.I4]